MKNESKNPILELQKVSKIYWTRGSMFGRSRKKILALNEVSLEVQRGEIFGLVGESGSGKTTAGRLIVRLEDPYSGKIYLEGEEIPSLKGKGLKAFRKRVQMIFQDPYQSINPQLSVFDTVSEPLLIHKVEKQSQRREITWEALQSVGLSPAEDFIDRYPHQLSGGQRQRVAIARAMVLKPSLVVADEPTSMLDASISAQIFNILIEMRDQLQATLLFITHSLAAARYLCDRIAVIYRGNLMELGPAEEVISRPKHPYTQALLDALPKFGRSEGVKRYGTFLRTEREVDGSVGCPFFVRCKVAHRLRCSVERPELRPIADRRLVACFYSESGDEPVPKDEECICGI
jgi:oligopeptide/dipeptide ABC transporter ATP-binding protein